MSGVLETILHHYRDAGGERDAAGYLRKKASVRA